MTLVDTLSTAPPEAGREPDIVTRATTAALACIARFGTAKLTVDDVARAAGCSRATLYRAFPSKQALVAAAVEREAQRITRVILEAVAGAPTLVDALTDAIVVGARELRSNDALRFVAEHEPEVVQPHLSFAGGNRFLAAAARRLSPAFVPWCAAPDRAAEWTVRVGLALVCDTEAPVDLADREAVRAFVATFVAPGLGTPGALPEED